MAKEWDGTLSPFDANRRATNGQQATITVTEQQMERLADALESPPQPNQALREAMSRYRAGRHDAAPGVPVETIRAEISLILTDPDSKLSDGAVRALRYISQVVSPSSTGAIPTDSIDRLTRQKAAHIIERDGFKVSGVVLTKPGGDSCIVDKGAVRWLDSRQLFSVMHPDAPSNGDAERDRRDAERYRHVRAHGMPKLCPAGFYYHDGVFYPTADAAIDAYVAASKGEGGA